MDRLPLPLTPDQTAPGGELRSTLQEEEEEEEEEQEELGEELRKGGEGG